MNDTAVGTNRDINARLFKILVAGGNNVNQGRRLAAADANPYLVLACALAGVHHGITAGLSPTPPAQGNAGAEADPHMPLTLWAALDRAAGSAFLADWLGPRYPAAYAAIKRAEFEAFMAQVFPREYDWYL